MLDFNRLVDQIRDVGLDSVRESPDSPIVELACRAFDDAAISPEVFEQTLDEGRELVLWPVASMLEPFGTTVPVLEPPTSLTVVAVDGSQIMPSHHEVHSCYLLNIGLAVIRYGEKSSSTLLSLPSLYHRPEDLYPLVDRRRMHIDELYVSLERTALELETSVAHAIQAGPGTVVFLDGSLIPWSADRMSPAYRERFTDRMERSLGLLRENRIPLVGYISHSRSSDVINMLRTSSCPYERPDCRTHCGGRNEEDFPCSSIWPLADRQLFGWRLSVNERSNIFLSGARMSRLMGRDNQICFAYVRLESEIARLELPRWVVEDHALKELVMSTVRSQVEKGRGYPLGLSEAHHLAVIKARDREKFFQLMTRHLVALGLGRVGTSPKERTKRSSFV